ncbi:aquaporin-11 isoform X2 [Periplaneta americana]
MALSPPGPQKTFLNACLKLCRRAAGASSMLPSLVVSALFILLTLVLAHAARRLIDNIIKDPFIRQLLQEFIAAAELCGCCFELIIVADNFGVSTYAVFLFLLTIWWSLNWGDATACPYTHMEDVVKGETDIRTAIIKSFFELSGGMLVFKYVQLLWSLEIAETHRDRAFSDCSTDLQVPVLYGAAIEGVATCLCRLASKTLSDLGPRFSTAIDSFIATSLVVAAFDYSGGYFNPVLATSLKYGCHGNTLIEHVVVYWMGASLGAIASVYLYRHPTVQKLLIGEEKEKEE